MRIEFHANIHCPGSSKERGSLVPVISHLAVSVVMHCNDIMFFAELNNLFKKLHICDCSSWIIRVVKKEKLCPFKNIRRNRIQVRQEIVFGFKRQWIRLSTRKKRTYFVNRIPRISVKHDVPRVDKSKWDMCNRLL